ETASLPPIKVQLYKNLPMGAGLGGGSSDAAFFIDLLNSKFGLGLTSTQMGKMASKIGSDCSFFIKNHPVLAKGKGDEFSEIKIDLSGYYILIVFPNINSNTKEAYDGIVPSPPKNDLKNIIENKPVSQWKDHLTNDFEETVFIKYPQIKELKQDLYASGALYASMSGSGSSVFGIFDKQPATNFKTGYRFYLQTPASKIL
ncbi:MAG: 4-(cytidine 5'-diphospho)-2-C-methyl-D-erythritol kinase, partial [Bacteroidia bacterium]